MRLLKTLKTNGFFRKLTLSTLLIATTLCTSLPVYAGTSLLPGYTGPIGGPRPLPDLRPDVYPTPISCQQQQTVGQVMLFDSGVKNWGYLPTSGFNVKWFVNDIQVAYGPHNGIGSHTTVMDGNSQLLYTFNSPGTYKITFQVDADNQLAEQNEANNSVTTYIFIYPVDLEPTQITSSLAYPKIWQKITFNTSVKNTGYQNSGDFAIAWYVNDTPVGFGGHNSIPGHSTVDNGNSALDYTFGTPGTYKITVEVDAGYGINEAFEENNKTSMYITVTN